MDTTRIAVTDRQVSIARYESQVSKNKHISRHSPVSTRASIAANTKLAAENTASIAGRASGSSSDGKSAF